MKQSIHKHLARSSHLCHFLKIHGWRESEESGIGISGLLKAPKRFLEYGKYETNYFKGKKLCINLFGIWFSLSCVPWFPGYTSVHMTNLTRSFFKIIILVDFPMS